MRLFKKLRKDERGSVVLFIVYVIALFGGAFIYTYFHKAMTYVADATTWSGSQWNFLVWFLDWGIPILMFIGVSLWFISQLQKPKYTVG